ncbi:hypothetical protein NPIL_585701 [Nephila pilipes]|uniref:Uncharacterized protein n=1 Tax=Nephila pilipes TaxID=299642 RepID=A0A8X6I926_NEPPI|nr:hypothetical protein NPIL_585701 [Nephila pilipes]
MERAARLLTAVIHHSKNVTSLPFFPSSRDRKNFPLSSSCHNPLEFVMAGSKQHFRVFFPLSKNHPTGRAVPDEDEEQEPGRENTVRPESGPRMGSSVDVSSDGGVESYSS